MLALILYTGCDCNYDLCKSQRNGNYSKWQIFDKYLYDAIYKLHKCEVYLNTPLYSGLQNVKLKKNQLLVSFLPTYVSSSYVKDVALSFIKKSNGMLIEMDKNICNQFICCSVVWISKFPDECEILIARSIPKNNNCNNPLDFINDRKNMNRKQRYNDDNYRLRKTSSNYYKKHPRRSKHNNNNRATLCVIDENYNGLNMQIVSLYSYDNNRDIYKVWSHLFKYIFENPLQLLTLCNYNNIKLNNGIDYLFRNKSFNSCVENTSSQTLINLRNDISLDEFVRCIELKFEWHQIEHIQNVSQLKQNPRLLRSLIKILCDVCPQ